MLAYINNDPDNVFNTVSQGLKKIKSERFVGILPEHTADYLLNKSNCMFKATGARASKRFKNFIMNKDNPYVDALSF